MQKRSFLPVLIWLVFVTYMSLNGGVQLPKMNLISADKLGHAAAYAVMVWLLLAGFEKAKNRPTTRGEQVLAFIAVSGYGAFMEWVQGTFFPNRFFEFDDMLANSAGAFLAIMLFRFWRKWSADQASK